MTGFPGKAACRRQWLDELERELAKACDLAREQAAGDLFRRIDRALTDIGIFVRVADATDRRRVFIELSDAAATQILNFLGEAKRAGVALV